MTVLTWNVSAVNNNPFEYWLSYDEPTYIDLMMGVEALLAAPGDDDVEVGSVFTEEMFRDVLGLMAKENMEGLEEVEALWSSGELRLQHRRIISEFVQERCLGDKRIISMPDRITNTINVVTRKESAYQPPPACRPSVMNNFAGDLSSLEVWWEQWKKFMFQDALTVRSNAGISIVRPVEMLELIPRSKYPALTEQEERLSVPLQVVCLAIFDAIIVHLMNKLSPNNVWQVVKTNICDNLYRNKNKRTAQILAERYSCVDVICLQEVAAVFREVMMSTSLTETHCIVVPEKLDGKRDQNSLLLLRKSAIVADSIREVTSDICSYFRGDAKLAAGDLIALEADGVVRPLRYLILSYHGDTNGLLTIPLLEAVALACEDRFKEHHLVFGLDANLYAKAEEGKQNFDDCFRRLVDLRFSTCWGRNPVAASCLTTCCARTSLQPQLNKAVRYADRITKSGMDPKDLIVFREDQFSLVPQEEMGNVCQPNPLKDNTGCLRYLEAHVFPSLDFPSDHGILAAALRRVPCSARVPSDIAAISAC